MSSGTLVLASNVPGIRDQLAEAPEQLFEAGNVGEMADKLGWALGLKADASAKIVLQQRQVIQARYTIEKEVALHEAFYRKVVGR